MASDPRAPVLIGLGETVHRPGEPAPENTEPAALMAEAIRAAVADAGSDGVLEAVETIAVAPSAAWTDGDPGRRVAELLELGGDVTSIRASMQGGNGPQLLVNVLAQRIVDGELDAAIVCGAEALSTLAGAMKTQQPTGWPDPDSSRRPDEVLEQDASANTDAEIAVGLIAPIMAYPLIENAIRRDAGRTQDEHLDVIAGLWSRFSEVAATQPNAWSSQTYTTEELRTATPGNRQVTLPYLKLLNSNIQVDQGGAVILTSVAKAQELGVPEDRWVYVHAGARATDEWFLSERHELHRSPAIRACGQAVYEHAGIGPDDLGPVDLYSCFPSAVQLGARELGLSLDRELTCTGGLTFFGGPGNNYATHGIIAVARRLRDADPGTVGLSTALGWYATKHAVGLYGNAAPSQPFAAYEPELEPTPKREVAPAEELTATAETCTLIYDKSGPPSYGILFALLDDGRRAVAKTDDPDTMAAMAEDSFLGSTVTVHADRSFSLA
jgi:acetyl-CoA C-acetyltransferase